MTLTPTQIILVITLAAVLAVIGWHLIFVPDGHQSERDGVFRYGPNPDHEDEA